VRDYRDGADGGRVIYFVVGLRTIAVAACAEA
jgi:hypothetical protein